MKKKRRKNYSLFKQENTINIVLPLVGVFSIIGVVLIVLGSFIRKNEEFHDDHAFAFLNGLIQKTNETGDLMILLGILILIGSAIAGVVAFFTKHSKSNFDRYDRW
ncbi:MAG: hypothetical protein ACOX56_05960 [Acholeplasmataceae bacterium]|jgi:uncharacterized membrane protein